MTIVTLVLVVALGEFAYIHRRRFGLGLILVAYLYSDHPYPTDPVPVARSQ